MIKIKIKEPALTSLKLPKKQGYLAKDDIETNILL